MSELVPAVVNAPKDESVSGWGRFYDAFQQKFFNCTEEVLGSMAGFQKELLAHLNEMTELNSQIAKRNATLAMKLSDFERDICQIRDYYDRIIDSTKTVVDYGSDQTVIPHIERLIEEKRYLEAQKEVNGFLHYLHKLIGKVEGDINSLHEECPDLEEVKKNIKGNIEFSDPTNKKQLETQVSQYRVFRLGASTMVYMIAGAATGLIIASYLPQETANVTKVVTSAGSEVFSFYTNSVLTGLKSVMENSNLTQELRKQAESNIIGVCRCLLGFYEQLNRFQSDIGTIKKTISGLKDDMAGVKDEVDCDKAEISMVAKWAYVVKILRQMFGSFTRLSTRVIEKQNPGFNDQEFHDVMERLNRSVELTTLGTPV